MAKRGHPHVKDSPGACVISRTISQGDTLQTCILCLSEFIGSVSIAWKQRVQRTALPPPSTPHSPDERTSINSCPILSPVTDLFSRWWRGTFCPKIKTCMCFVVFYLSRWISTVKFHTFDEAEKVEGRQQSHLLCWPFNSLVDSIAAAYESGKERGWMSEWCWWSTFCMHLVN